MNILLLHCHDGGRYIQPYGYPVETPNLMRLAQEGVLFRKAFCCAPTCSPSRAALLTGQYPHQIGVYGLTGNAPSWRIDDYQKHLVQFLNRQGFETVLAGVQHETGHDDLSPLGYQRILDTRPEQGQFYEETADHVQRFFAERFMNRGKKQKPFFLSVGIDEPHNANLQRPELGLFNAVDKYSKTRYYDPQKLDARYTAPLPWLPDLPEIRRDVESFHEGVRIMDDYVGQVLYALKHYGLEEDTLVIFTTDHGIDFPHAKMTLTDQGVGVMFIMRGPGGFSGGRVIEPLVSHLDVYPTICALLGAQPPAWLEGKNLLPLVKGEVPALHEEVFAEQTYHGGMEPLRAIRTERHKLVLRHFPTGPRHRHHGETLKIIEPFGWYDRKIGTVELFDLYLDPMEVCNRAGDPDYRSVREDLERRLRAWMERTGDPFPTGQFPSVPGAREGKPVG